MGYEGCRAKTCYYGFCSNEAVQLDALHLDTFPRLSSDGCHALLALVTRE